MVILSKVFASPNYKDFAQKNKNLYDIVIKIDSILDLTDGWKVSYPLFEKYKKEFEKTQHSEEVTKNIETQLKSDKENPKAVVSILGLYNRGKSYVLAKIFELDLLSSYFVHTEGLSIVSSRADIADVIYGIDTKGSQKPVPNGDESKINDSEATERFLQSLSLNLSNVVLIIVNRLTRDDQSYIKQVKQTFQHPIIVVHNLSCVNTMTEMSAIIKEEIIDCFDCIEHRPNGESPYWTSKHDNTRHVVLAKDEKMKDSGTQGLPDKENAGVVYNRLTIKLLRDWLKACASTNHERFDIVQDTVSYTKNVISNYIEFVKAPIEVEKAVGADNPSMNIELLNESIVFQPPLQRKDLKYADIRFNMVGIILDNINTTARVEEDPYKYYISLDCTGFTIKELRFHFENGDKSTKIKVTSTNPRKFPNLGQNMIHNDLSKVYSRPLEWSYQLPSPTKERCAYDLAKCVKSDNGILTIELNKFKVEDDGRIEDDGEIN